MFTLVGVKEVNSEKVYIIHDDTDSSFEVASEEMLKRVIVMGLSIQGITRTATGFDGSFTYSSEFFLPEPEEDEDDYEDSEEDYDDWSDDDSEDLDETLVSEDTFEPEEDTDDDWEDDYDDWDESEAEDEDDDDDWGDEYDDWDDSPEDSEIDKLYAMLNKEQSDLLKRYYLWTSQILFQNGSTVHGVQRLSAKNTKRAQDKIANIDALRKQGKTWVYAGYLDLGYRGADTCNLCGSPLRYQHYICDASVSDVETMFFGEDYSNIDMIKLSDHIANGDVFPFGIECTGDFFDIPKEDLIAIKKNQRDATEEMKFMYRLMCMPDSYNNAIKSLRVFENIMDTVVVSTMRSKLFARVSRFESPLLSFYSQFKNAGLLYPRSLVLRLWHILIEKQYPLRVTKFVPQLSRKTLSELANIYLASYYKREAPEDVKIVQEVLEESSLGSLTTSPLNYLHNLFSCQFQGIYTFNPTPQKNISGVIDSPRCRDLGGSNKQSRITFGKITGVSGNASLPKSNYEGYPMSLNQPNVNGIVLSDGCEFTQEYLFKLCLCCYYYSEHSSHSISRFEFNAKIRGFVYDYERGDGYKKRADTYMSAYDMRPYLKQAKSELKARVGVDEKDLSLNSTTTVYIAKGVTKAYRKYMDTLDDLLEVLRSDSVLIKKMYKGLEDIIDEAIEKEIRVQNELLDKIKEEKRKVNEAEVAKQEELYKKLVDQSDKHPTGISIDDINYTGLSQTDIDNFKLALNIKKGIKKGVIQNEMLVSVMAVASENKLMHDVIASKGDIYFSIYETVKRNNGAVSVKQAYRLKQALDAVVEIIQFGAKDDIKNPNLKVNTSSVDASNNDSVDSATDTTKNGATVVSVPLPSEEEVEEQPIEATETVEESTVGQESIEEQPVVNEEPTGVSAEAYESSSNTTTVDIYSSPELRDLFNKAVDGLSVLKAKVSIRDYTRYGMTLRAIKSSLKVTPRQRETLLEIEKILN